MKYRFTTVPTGGKKGPWRDSVREAKEDAVAAECGELADDAPDGIRLDLMVEIEEQAEGLSDAELWAVAAETLRQHGDGAPVFVADRIGALVLDGDTRGVEAWKSIAARIQEIMQRSATHH
jgi:hypothetical protein